MNLAVNLNENHALNDKSQEEEEKNLDKERLKVLTLNCNLNETLLTCLSCYTMTCEVRVNFT